MLKTLTRNDIILKYLQSAKRENTLLKIPTMFAFLVLLILMNVDFACEMQQDLFTKTSAITSVIELQATATATRAVFQTTSNELLLDPADPNHAAICQSQNSDPCYPYCVGGNLNMLRYDLEIHQERCTGDLSLKLENCLFPSQTLKEALFRGSFNLRNLDIINCDLLAIEEGAFKVGTMNRLATLIIKSSTSVKVNERTFEGLTVLQEFCLNNFQGIKFMQPFAKTVEHVKLYQTSDATLHDPLNWLDGEEIYASLTRLDLSGNNFGDILTRMTFDEVSAVRELILANCAITFLEANTFSGIIQNLQILDLSSNALKTLDVTVLSRRSCLHLELHSNAWICSCINYELIEALQSNQFVYTEEPYCASPEQLNNQTLKQVSLSCKQLICKHPVVTNYTISIRNGDARFTIQRKTTTSVVLRIFSSKMEQFIIIYFAADGRANVNASKNCTIHEPANCHFEQSEAFSTLIYVQGLISKRTYLFCLVPLDEQTASPFNCQSQYLEALSFTGLESLTWLLMKDQAWILTLFVFGILLTLCLGLFLTYWLLRWRPKWLRFCKRIIAVSSLSQQVFLLPKLQTQSAQERINRSDNDINTDVLRANLSEHLESYDYIEFSNDLQEPKDRSQLSRCAISTPSKGEPNSPDAQTSSQLSPNNLKESCHKDECVDEIINYYEELF